MGLSNDLVSQLAKLTVNKKDTTKEATVYGTVKEVGNTIYVQLDGSEVLTPLSSTADVKPGERVTVLVKNHTATATGNLSSPSARTEDVKNVSGKVNQFETVMAYKVTGEDLEVINAIITNLKSVIGSFEDLSAENLEAVNADIDKIYAKYAEMDIVSAEDIQAVNADIENLKAKIASFTDVSTENLSAANAEIGSLEAYTAKFTYVSVQVLDALKAEINDLDVEKLATKEAEIKYVNIDFSNIDKAWIEDFYSKSGLVECLTIKDATVTGQLVGVTIKGDKIEANTIVADKLVIQGNDGIYYKLNTSVYDEIYCKVNYNSETNEYVATDEIIDDPSGSIVKDTYTTTNDAVYAVTTDTETIYYCKNFVYDNKKIDIEEVHKNGLDGRAIIAKTITADRLDVTDLVAIGATIGGFKITSGDENTPGGIHSFAKEDVRSSNRGSYLDNEGQFAFGDSINFIRYAKQIDEDGNDILDDDGNPIYKLEMAVDSIVFNKSGRSVDDLLDCIKIGSYENKPCVELSEENGDSKTILTNEKIVTDKVDTKELNVDGDFNQNGFVWGVRENGNYGLMWRGVTE